MLEVLSNFLKEKMKIKKKECDIDYGKVGWVFTGQRNEYYLDSSIKIFQAYIEKNSELFPQSYGPEE